MAAAAVPMMIAGTAIQAAGSIQQGYADSSVAQYNAQVADQNAQISLQQGAEEARRSVVNSRKFIGQEQAGYGAAGVSGGSSQWVMRASAAQGELNALTIQNNAQTKAIAYENEAGLDRFRAGNDVTHGYVGAASSLLSGAARGAGFMGVGGGGGGGGGITGVSVGDGSWAD